MQLLCRAKSGGPDPEANVALQQVIEQARKANVPKDIIERNLKRAEDKDSANLSDEVRPRRAPFNASLPACISSCALYFKCCEQTPACSMPPPNARCNAATRCAR